MPKKVIDLKCPKCGALFRSKLVRNIPVRGCPHASCGWVPAKK